jgi:putative oxidoreductase
MFHSLGAHGIGAPEDGLPEAALWKGADELWQDGEGLLEGGAMTNPELVGVAALLLRLSLAIMFYAHAWVKIKVFTPAGTVKYFESLGVPGWFAYATMAAEIGGATLLLLGIETRWVALLLVPLMLGTIVLVHGRNGWMFTNKDGGWEYPAFWTVGLLVLALLGDGSAALGPMMGL